MRDAYVYIMSNKSHRLYVGATVDLANRVFVYFEVVRPYAAALSRERYVKGLLRSKKIAMIQAENPKWRDLSVHFDDLLMAR